MQEVTVWKCDFQPNHTYLFDGDKALAYIKKGESEITTLIKPLRIVQTGRKFVKVSISLFKAANIQQPKKVYQKPIGFMKAWKVVSADKTYLVELIADRYSCSCKGFEFRRTCKHIGAVQRKKNDERTN